METFLLGAFTHNNFPIGGETLLAQTTLSVDMTITNGSILNGVFPFVFVHDETFNNPSACPADSPPCDDIVDIPNPLIADAFTYGGMVFDFEILGFSQDGGGTVVGQFRTQEGQSNEAGLFAKITKVAQVPEPGALLVFGAGLAGLAVLRRHRKVA